MMIDHYNKFSKIVLIHVILCLSISLSGFSQKKVTQGPANGTLLLIGGNADDQVFLPEFKELIGNKESSIVIIPTARSKQTTQENDFFERHKKRFKKYGFNEITFLHTRNRDTANSEEFIRPLRKAKGVWIMGGRQWRLVDAYYNTLVHLELLGLLHRGGVIAGTSAGATIQGSFLVRGDTKTNTIMVGDHKKSFAFIENAAVDQHLIPRNRHFDMFEVLEQYPELLGIGLDENTGIIVNNNTFKVTGKNYVAIYDGTRWSAERDTIYKLGQDEEQFYFLNRGDRYNLKERHVVREDKD
jgi:cyanophycinase